MRSIRTLLLAALVAGALLTATQASACAPDNVTGNYWYDWSDGSGRSAHCGTSTTACFHVLLVNEGCNGLSSYGHMNGSINWFGQGSPLRIIGAAPNGSPDWWQSINMWFWFQWDGNWEYAYCTPGGAYDWYCSLQQSHDGTTWGPNGTMHLGRFVQ